MKLDGAAFDGAGLDGRTVQSEGGRRVPHHKVGGRLREKRGERIGSGTVLMQSEIFGMRRAGRCTLVGHGWVQRGIGVGVRGLVESTADGIKEPECERHDDAGYE